MLLFLAVICLIVAFVLFALISLSNGMAAAPGVNDASLWPAGIFALVAIALFIAHFYLRNVSMHW